MRMEGCSHNTLNMGSLVGVHIKLDGGGFTMVIGYSKCQQL